MDWQKYSGPVTKPKVVKIEVASDLMNVINQFRGHYEMDSIPDDRVLMTFLEAGVLRWYEEEVGLSEDVTDEDNE